MSDPELYTEEETLKQMQDLLDSAEGEDLMSQLNQMENEETS